MASAFLRETQLICADYLEVSQKFREGDFVYLDPPYLPVGGFADFRRYTKEFFSEQDHVRLTVEFRNLTQRGVKALLSNSATEKIRYLYKNFPMITVGASRQISCRGTTRGKVDELLVANYPMNESYVLSGN
jgi:DNA adenine methylase